MQSRQLDGAEEEASGSGWRQDGETWRTVPRAVGKKEKKPRECPEAKHAARDERGSSNGIKKRENNVRKENWTRGKGRSHLGKFNQGRCSARPLKTIGREIPSVEVSAQTRIGRKDRRHGVLVRVGVSSRL